MIIVIDTDSITEALRVGFALWGVVVTLAFIGMKLEDLWVTYHSNRRERRYLNSDEYRQRQEHYRQQALFWESFVGPRKPYDDTGIQGPVGIKGPEGIEGPSYSAKDLVAISARASNYN